MYLSTSSRNRYLLAVLSLAMVYGIAAVGMAADESEQKKQTKSAEATKTDDVKFESITIKVPKSWQWKPNLSKLNKKEFEIPPVKGDSESAELYVSFLFNSDGESGETIKSWIKQFQPDGRKAKVTEGTSPQGKYTIVDVTGTFNKPVSVAVEPTRPLPDARMLATVLTTKEGWRYVFILSGPNKTVTAAAKAFRDSFAADAEKEKEIKLKEGSK